ncbi:hypothetical protein L4D76_20580 [Photobacterium sagamiensis]|uniref:hypothetical protein n=1 Tax=Photobacterium sagamiensis TaxID=2910241 RepID=UPI003D0EA5C7
MTNTWQVESDKAYAELEFGTAVYKACTHCQSAIEIIPLLSGNTLGGTLWSDGFLETDQMPNQDLLGRCRHCNNIVCLSDLKPYPQQEDPADTGDHSYLSLTLADYEMLLQQLGNIAEHYHPYLRLKFWQRSNDQRRYSDPTVLFTEQEQQNLQALLPLLGDEDAGRLLKAEIYRQQGEFEHAQRVLSDPFDHRVSEVVMRLKQLVREKNQFLTMIFSGKAEGNSATCCNTTTS